MRREGHDVTLRGKDRCPSIVRKEREIRLKAHRTHANLKALS